MRSPEEIQRLAKQFWVDEAFTDEASLSSYAHYFISEIHKLCQAWDLDGVEDWLAVYQTAEARCKAEPLATPYEHALMLITLSIADTHAAMGNFSTMYMLFEQILTLLREGDERRERLGLMPRGSSELRYNLLGSLATAKWQGAAEDRDRLLSVEDVADSFKCVVEHVLQYLVTHPGSDDGRKAESIEINGLEVASMLYRWFYEEQYSKVVSYIDWYNIKIGNHLSSELGHYLSSSPVAESWYYWSFELAKLHSSGQLTREMLEHCHKQRVAVVLKSLSQPRHIDGLYGSWETEIRLMIKALESRRNGQKN